LPIKKLKSGELFELTAPFLPAPLIDKATSLGAKHWINEKSNAEFLIYFIKE
jgi:hypothetical protein